MPRNKVNKAVNKPIGQRLEQLVVNHLGLNWVSFASKLGYTNSSTLHKIKCGDTSISAEKLFEIAMIPCLKGSINLHWLITGKGEPFLAGPSCDELVELGKSTRVSIDDDALAEALVRILRRSTN